MRNGYHSERYGFMILQVIDAIGYTFFKKNVINNFQKPHRLLLLNLGDIGDLIIFRYVIANLLNYSYEITLVINDKYRFLFNDLKKINIIGISKYQDRRFIKISIKLWYLLKNNFNKYYFDIACHFRSYLGTGILPTHLSKVARYQIGFGTAGFGFLLDHVIKWEEGIHESQQYLKLINLFHNGYNYIDFKVFSFLNNKFACNTLNINSKNYIVIHATSMDNRKNIYKNILQDVINIVKLKTKIIFTGLPNEINYLKDNEIYEDSNIIFSHGKIDFLNLRNLIKDAKFFIGIDSSIAHLIADINICKFIFWHNVNDVRQWRPLGINYQIIKMDSYNKENFAKKINNLIGS